MVLHSVDWEVLVTAFVGFGVWDGPVACRDDLGTSVGFLLPLL